MSRGRKPNQIIKKDWESIFLNSVGSYVQLINSLLSKSTKPKPLSNYIKIVGGYAFKSSNYSTTGIPVIRISDFNNERIILDNVKYYKENEALKKYELYQGDIIIALTGGTIAKLGIVQEGIGKLYLNQRVGKFEILDKNIFEKEYVYWIARSVQGIIKTLAWGAAIPNVSPKQIEKLKFPIPKKKVQKGIINFLNDLKNNKIKSDIVYFDSKIENQIILMQQNQVDGTNLFTELTHQLDLVKKLRQSFLREAMQGKLLKSSPPLKEGWPKAGAVDDKLNRFPQKEVVDKKINNLPYLKTFRKELRNNLTPAEAKLWTLIKGKQLEGRKFRRQFSVANYILDFYCPSENLAIELDGQGHFEASQAEYDYERDLFLNNYGIKVLRFENKWVWDNPEGLLEEIKRNFGWKKNNPSILRTAPLEGEQPETGADLLAKIKAEKEQLIKEKKIRKPKPLPPITKEEIPFEIPENWVWCRLGLPIFYTDNLDIQKKLSAETIINYVDIDCIDNSKQSIREVKTRRVSELSTRARRVLKKGFVVYSTVRPYLKNIAIIEDELPKMIGTTGFNVFKPILISTKYIFYFLLNPDLNKKFEEMMIGFNSPSITNVQFENTLLPLPPLSEQKRIVAKLDELMAYCDSLEASIKNSQKQNEMLLGQVLREALEPKEITIKE